MSFVLSKNLLRDLVTSWNFMGVGYRDFAEDDGMSLVNSKKIPRGLIIAWELLGNYRNVTEGVAGHQCHVPRGAAGP